MNETELE